MNHNVICGSTGSSDCIHQPRATTARFSTYRDRVYDRRPERHERSYDRHRPVGDRWTPKPKQGESTVDNGLVKTQEVSRVVVRGAKYGHSFKHGGIMSSCFMNLHLCAYVCNHHVVYKDQGDTVLLLTF